MDEVLKRKLFNTPKYEHKSTGIASGLEYRPGYKVGGRVGLHSGGPPHDHPEDFEYMTDYNPELGISLPPELQKKYGPKLQLYEDLSETRGPMIEGLPSGGTGIKDETRRYLSGLGVFDEHKEITSPSSSFKGGKMSSLAENMSTGRFVDGEWETIDEWIEDRSDNLKRDQLFGDPHPTLTKMIEEMEADKEIYLEQQKKDTEKLRKDQQADDPGPLGRPGDFYESKNTGMNKDDTSAVKSLLLDSYKAVDSSWDDLDKNMQELRERQDKDTRALREKQSTQKNKLALLNMIAAANNPNLRVGQSRVAAGAGALTESAREKMAWKDEVAQADLDKKHMRELEDQNMAYARYADDLKYQRSNAQMVLSGKIQRELSRLGEKDPIRVQTAQWIMDNNNRGDYLFKYNKEELTKILERVLGTEEQPMDIDDQALLIHTLKFADANVIRAQIGAKEEFEDDGVTPKELTTDEIQNYIEMQGIGGLAGIEYDADGGRVGYQEGGGVETEEGVPMVMTYEQLRDKLPPFITDDIVKLIAYSPEAFKDFANIQTKQDVEEFNDKYDVDLVLPDPEQMDYAMPSTPAAETPATGSVSVPPAVAANPQMPMQTGTGALTPTETALLDPTEQAIRMRNR